MEQQKILWVVFSIGLLLLVIVVGALVFITPSKNAGNMVVENIQPNTTGSISSDSYEYLKGGDITANIPDTDKLGDGSEIGLTDDTKLSAETAEIKENVLIEKPKTEGKTLDDIKKTAVKQNSVENTVKKPVERTEVKAEAPKKTVNEYWIQAASFSSKYRADEAVNMLSEKGFAARIVSKEINGASVFRVRIGPYSVKAEAEKFLTWVKEVKGFETSYISSISVLR